MYVSIVDFTVGQGDADTLLQRIEGDLVPVYRDAEGFVAYYAIKQSDNSVTTIRVFNDQASLEAAYQGAAAATDQIVSDLQVEATQQINGEASVAVTPVEGVAPVPVTLQSLTINPVVAAGPITAYGIITLSSPAPAEGVTVQLTKGSHTRTPDTSVFVPGSQVTIPANSNSGSFGIQCDTLTAGDLFVIVTATLEGSNASVYAVVIFVP